MANERPESDWPPARLIPVSGIRGTKEQEQRATSALLAVMAAVPSFGKAVLKYLDAPSGRLSTFAEVSFRTDDGGKVTPDGALVVEWGKTRWVCLVEVKTGSTELTAQQVDKYLIVANREGFDAVLTISNQIVSSPGDSPVDVDRRRLRSLKLRHLSWFRIFTEAVNQHEHKGVDDPEQRWLLGDLIAFLDNEKSGASGFEGMGKHWVTIRDAARQRTLSASDTGIEQVAQAWEQFLEYLCLRLRQRIGRPVEPDYPRGSTATKRVRQYVKTLAQGGQLEGAIDVPDAIGPIRIEVDLTAQQVTASTSLRAPKEGKRPTTRINWLLRQLRDAPDDLRIDVDYPYLKTPASQLLSQAKDDPDCLLHPDDPKRHPQRFRVALSRDMGKKAGKGRGSFVLETMQHVLGFYGEVVQELKEWTPPAPKLTRSDREAVREAEEERKLATPKEPKRPQSGG
jgi:hypothetical protein